MESTKVGAIIPAGGYGSLDGNFSKLGTELDGRPMIAHVIEKVLLLKHANILSDVCIVLNSKYEAEIRQVLENHLPGVDYQSLVFALQTHRCGAAGAVELALPKIPTAEQIFVTFGDMPLWRVETMTQLIQEHQRVSAQAEYAFSMVTLEVSPGDKAWKYGRVISRDGKIVAIIEPKNSRLNLDDFSGVTTVNPSLYVFDRAFLEQHLSSLELHEGADGFPGERHLPELVVIAHDFNKPIHLVPLLDSHEARGVNTKTELMEVQIVLNNWRKSG